MRRGALEWRPGEDLVPPIESLTWRPGDENEDDDAAVGDEFDEIYVDLGGEG